MGEKQTEGLCLACGGQELTCCARSVLGAVQMPDADKKPSPPWLRRKKVVLTRST